MDLVALAPRELGHVLIDELGDRIIEQRDRLFLIKGKARPLFCQNLWLEPRIFKFKSISEAAKHLRSIQRNWWLHSTSHHRRAKLIAEQLPVLKPKRLDFLAPIPKSPLGSWTLLDSETMLYSTDCSSPFPDGEIEFNEDKENPPSRAYLKLWELFTITGVYPRSGSRVVDLGSSPGGWTWVLDALECQVISVDKAPLSPQLKLSNRVEYRAESAFAMEPFAVDWLFSDVICYPDRLLKLVQSWESVAANMVCTIKFQGQTDFKIVSEFLKVPGSGVIHLYNNKHELTWFRFKT